MTNPLDTLKREGSIALWHDYRLGHAKDLSGNGNDGTLVNDPWFDRNGLNTTYMGDEAVRVAHSDSINLTTLSVVVLIVSNRIRQTVSSLPTIFRKGLGGANLCYQARVVDTTGTSIDFVTSAGAARWVTRDMYGVTCIGMNGTSGTSNLSIYFDGVLEDPNLTISPSIITNTDDLYIGNWWFLSRGFGRTISSFILFNKLLSATEHAQVYGQLMKTRRGLLA